MIEETGRRWERARERKIKKKKSGFSIIIS